MKSFEQELNEKVSDYFKKLERELNRNSFSYGYLNPGNVYSVPQIVELGNFQRIPTTDDAFNLSPIRAGGINDVQIEEKDKNKIIIRRALGYTIASRIQMSEEPVDKFLRPLVTEMLLTLKTELGYSDIDPHYGTFAQFVRPGSPGVYFRDLADSAALELRLFSDTYPMIAIKK